MTGYGKGGRRDYPPSSARGAAKPAIALSLIADDADQFGCSISRSTAGEVEDGTRAERAFFRRQPSHARGDFLRFPQPTQRNLRKHVVDMGLRHLREQWRSYAVGVTQFTRTEVSANSFPRDFVRAITA